MIVMLAVVLSYTAVALYRYYNYSILTAKTEATSTKWTIQEKADDEFLLVSHYQFDVNGKIVVGETVFKDEVYRNSWAAEQDIAKYTLRKWDVWYSPRNPDDSTLQKNFPLKEVLSAGFLWCLLLYFLWLGYYVSRFKQN